MVGMKATPAYKNPKKPVEARVRDLLRRMTLEEKAAQLIQHPIGRDTNPNNVGPDHPFDPTVGSILSFTGGAAARNAFQRMAVEGTRLGIPILWGYDVVHGWRTGFPVPLAQACSFDPSLTERACRVAARECWADGGVDWTFAPMVEVGHDPRWGRNVEGFGEDPFTNGRFAAASVRGYQGRTPAQLRGPGRVAACLKHFCGYSACEGGRDYSYTDISPRALREWYLPPFEAGVRAGARTVMSSFNCVNGTPAVAHRGLLTDTLRGEWGFDGFVVSDWGAVTQMRIQRFTADPARQTLAALGAGNDMDMSDDVYRNIPDLVRAGRLPRRVLDEAVARVLRVKFECGLFERPYVPELPREKTCRLPADLDLAAECARGCAVLLKNERGLLPLDAAKVRRLALVGPAADDCPALVGTWAAMCAKNHEETPSLRDEAARFFPNAKIDYAPGCALPPEGAPRLATVDFVEGSILDPGLPPDRAAIARAVRAARAADVVVVALGEPGWLSGENKSRRDIRLSPAQVALVDALAQTGKPLVGLVAAGRPLAFPETAAKLDAILYLWQGGSRAAQAAWELVTGAANPSGRLAMTFPRAVGQIPVFYNAQPRNREDLFDYLDRPSENDPWLPFGFGLSYTTFEYGKVKVASRRTQVAGRKSQVRPVARDPRPAAFVSASVTVRNTGGRQGAETVIWYLSDPEATSTQPVRRVVGFEKVDLAPGEAKTVRIALSRKDLAAMRPDGTRRFEPGAFVLSASLRASAEFVAE